MQIEFGVFDLRGCGAGGSRGVRRRILNALAQERARGTGELLGARGGVPYEAAHAAQRTPPIVREWGYRMSMTMADFNAVFGRHEEGPFA